MLLVASLEVTEGTGEKQNCPNPAGGSLLVLLSLSGCFLRFFWSYVMSKFFGGSLTVSRNQESTAHGGAEGRPGHSLLT